MFVSRLELENWRNFRKLDVPLRQRMFIVGANASGKSNLLDVFRFFRDVAKPGGGLQYAISERGGLSPIRCLAARRYPDVKLEIELSEEIGTPAKWRYSIGIKQQQRGKFKPILAYERAWHKGVLVCDRPDKDDLADAARLTQTHMEQINSNIKFREIPNFLEKVTYLHLVPQLVRHSREFSGPGLTGDPFGRSFLERIGQVPEKTRRSRLKLIEGALTLAVPQLKELSYVTDVSEGGTPHLEALYEHWRPNGVKQREREFSDGTLRLLGLLWSLLDGDSMLLLEEPELSLNASIVRELAALIYRMQKRRNRQVLISTHSADLLQDPGIAPEEILLLHPEREGTTVQLAADNSEVRLLLEGGLTAADAVLPSTAPSRVSQLRLFG